MFNYALFDLIIYGICFFSFTSWILDKKESNKIKKNIDDVRPKVGMPSKEKIEILLALFSIRCAEISYLYGMLDERQKDAAEGNWLGSIDI